jgi:hypothetical protein
MKTISYRDGTIEERENGEFWFVTRFTSVGPFDSLQEAKRFVDKSFEEEENYRVLNEAYYYDLDCAIDDD